MEKPLSGKHVLFLSSLTTDSGSGIRFWNMARLAADAGASATFLERKPAGFPERKWPGVTYAWVPEGAHLPLSIFRSLRAGMKLARSRAWDAAYALKPMPNSALPALAAGRRGARALLDVDDLDFAYYPPGLAHRMVERWFRVYPQKFHAVSHHTPALGEFLLGEGRVQPAKVSLVPQGVDMDVFRAPARPVSEDIDRFTRDRLTWVYMASLGITSDFADVVPALGEALGRNSGWGVLVLGHGVRMAEYRLAVGRAGLSSRFHFAGYAHHPDIPSILARCGGGFHYLRPGGANRYRAVMKVREYLAAGIPVAANPSGDVGSFSPFVEIAPTLESYPDAMERALSPAGAERAGRGRAHVAQTLSWESIGPALADFILGSQRPAVQD